jgi:hypothetical protein
MRHAAAAVPSASGHHDEAPTIVNQPQVGPAPRNCPPPLPSLPHLSFVSIITPLPPRRRGPWCVSCAVTSAPCTPSFSAATEPASSAAAWTAACACGTCPNRRAHWRSTCAPDPSTPSPPHATAASSPPAQKLLQATRRARLYRQIPPSRTPRRRCRHLSHISQPLFPFFSPPPTPPQIWSALSFSRLASLPTKSPVKCVCVAGDSPYMVGAGDSSGNVCAARIPSRCRVAPCPSLLLASQFIAQLLDLLRLHPPGPRSPQAAGRSGAAPVCHLRHTVALSHAKQHVSSVRSSV